MYVSVCLDRSFVCWFFFSPSSRGDRRRYQIIQWIVLKFMKMKNASNVWNVWYAITWCLSGTIPTYLVKVSLITYEDNTHTDDMLDDTREHKMYKHTMYSYTWYGAIPYKNMVTHCAKQPGSLCSFKVLQEKIWMTNKSIGQCHDNECNIRKNL